MAVKPFLAEVFHPEWAEAVPDGLVGSRIIAIGAPADELDLDGGGLIIDYLPSDTQTARRLVLKFSELGMWVAYSGISA